MRSAWVFVCVGILLLTAVPPLSSAGPAAGEDEPDYPVFQVSTNPVLGFDVDIWQDRVVWASPADGSVEIRMANLTTGNETVVTEIADATGEVSVQSIAYDGRWIVWTDDRFGNPDLSAVDTKNGTLYRLSRSEKGETSPDVSNGFAVWLSGRNLTIANLETGEDDILHEKTALTPPQIVGSDLFWAGIQGTNTTAYLDDLDRQTVETLATIEDGGVPDASLSRDRAAWVASHLVIDEGEVQEIENFTVETVALGESNGEVRPVTIDSVGQVDSVATSGDWVAWKLGLSGRPGLLRMMHMPTGGLVPFQNLGTGGPVISDDYVAFIGADNATGNRTGGHLYGVELQPPVQEQFSEDTPVGMWLMVAGGAALVSVGIFWAPIRSFVARSLDRGS